MGFKRLFGIGDPDEAIEVDTNILGPVFPGGNVEGEVFLRGGARDTPIQGIYLNFTVQCTSYNGEERDYEFESSVADPSYFTLRKGEEQRLTFSERLSWEVPVSELGGRALGVVLSVKSSLRRDWNDDGTEMDNDLLHISALPLHEAVLDAFVEEGYHCDSANVIDSYVPNMEQHWGFYQNFYLTNRSAGPGQPEQLEVVFHMNAVGALVHVRRAVPSVRDWDSKPPGRRFPAAHHEVGHVDWRPQVRKALDELALLDDL
ncbi:sporulation protein [Streptomyces apocyni]|uniref:sporulation protein n=1 Tax=Streptomyces apocyni TaxID=2654677 RepID=UPI0018D00826|nr:sporulation protein [Streptomyces apocyni]